MSDCSTHAWDVPMSNRYTHKFGDVQWHEPRKHAEYPGMRRIERIVFDDGTRHEVDYPFVAAGKDVWAITLDNGESYMFHERLAKTNGKLCEEVNKLEDRVEALEELICDMRGEMRPFERDVFLLRYIDKRIAELGIEV